MVVIISEQNPTIAMARLAMEMVNMESGLCIYDSIKLTKNKKPYKSYNQYGNITFPNNNIYYVSIINNNTSSHFHTNCKRDIDNELKKLDNSHLINRTQLYNQPYTCIKTNQTIVRNIGSRVNRECLNWIYNSNTLFIPINNPSAGSLAFSPVFIVLDMKNIYKFNYYKDLNYPSLHLYNHRIYKNPITFDIKNGVNIHIFKLTKDPKIKKFLSFRALNKTPIIDWKDVKFLRKDPTLDIKSALSIQDFDFNKQEKEELEDCADGKPEYPYNRCFISNAILYDFIYVLEVTNKDLLFHILLAPCFVHNYDLNFKHIFPSDYKLKFMVTLFPTTFDEAIKKIDMPNVERQICLNLYNGDPCLTGSRLTIGEYTGYKNLYLTNLTTGINFMYDNMC